MHLLLTCSGQTKISQLVRILTVSIVLTLLSFKMRSEYRVLYGVESWSGVLGVEYWSGVQSNFGVAKVLARCS